MRNLLLFLIASVAAAGQDQPQFAGTWEGRFAGRVFCVLTLHQEGEIGGMLSPGTIELDDDGNLIGAHASESAEALPIQNAQVEGRLLRFEAKDDDNDLLRFELRLSSQGKAELRIVGLPMKPIAMTIRGK
jgi:hypothetical protein